MRTVVRAKARRDARSPARAGHAGPTRCSNHRLSTPWAAEHHQHVVHGHIDEQEINTTVQILTTRSPWQAGDTALRLRSTGRESGEPG